MKKTSIIAVIGVVASITAMLLIATTSTRPYLNVSQVTGNLEQYDGKNVDVIGVVLNFTSDNFTLNEDEESILVIVGSTVIPDEVANGVQVVVSGMLEIQDGRGIIHATQILSQCSNAPVDTGSSS